MLGVSSTAEPLLTTASTLRTSKANPKSKFVVNGEGRLPRGVTLKLNLDTHGKSVPCQVWQLGLSSLYLGGSRSGSQGAEVRKLGG